MRVPTGFLSTIWSCLCFLPFFVLILILGLVKAAIIGPIAVLIVLTGNSAVIIGLWPAHFIWTYYCVAKTKRLGLVLKILLLACLPVPLILWPIIGIGGSLLVGIGYGFFTPLVATFEASRQELTDKLFHYFLSLNVQYVKLVVYSSVECGKSRVQDLGATSPIKLGVKLTDIYLSQTPHKAKALCTGYDLFYSSVECQDGTWSTLKGSCTIVRDFTDFCFHSYFSYMDELSENIHEDERPMNIKLSLVPGCLLVILLAVPIDVLLITAVALYKSPYMLFKGWKRLLEDLIGREGPFLETVCVPFAGLAIILWPIVVLGALLSAFISSFFLGFYGAAVVHQENSFQMGLVYIVAVVSLFDEYTNDLLYLREGSCLPRPNYRRNSGPHSELFEKRSIDDDSANQNSRGGGSYSSKLVSERSRTLKWAIQQLKPMQVWDWLFQSCEVNGRLLLREGLIDVKDIEECILKGKCKKLGVKLPAWCILQCLLSSVRSNSTGLLISDEIELINANWPKDKVFEWFIGPLLIMKEQIKGLQLDENEEACLKILIMTSDNEKPEDWDGKFPSNDKVRRAQLQAILRRLQGIVASMTRIPTFRRRFNNLVKVLYIEAIETGALSSQGEGSSKCKTTFKPSSLTGQDARNTKLKAKDNSEMKDGDNASNGKAKERAEDDCGIV